MIVLLAVLSQLSCPDNLCVGFNTIITLQHYCLVYKSCYDIVSLLILCPTVFLSLVSGSHVVYQSSTDVRASISTALHRSRREGVTCSVSVSAAVHRSRREGVTCGVSVSAAAHRSRREGVTCGVSVSAAVHRSRREGVTCDVSISAALHRSRREGVTCDVHAGQPVVHQLRRGNLRLGFPRAPSR